MRTITPTILAAALAVSSSARTQSPFRVLDRMPPIPNPAALEIHTVYEVGDVTNDGAPDFVSNRHGSRPVLGGPTVWRNDGLQRWSATYTPTRHQPASGVAVGDVDQDGIADVVASFVTSNPGVPVLAWLRGNGLGGFVEAPLSSFAPMPSQVDHIELLDTDGDRDLDVVAAQIGTRELLFLNDGTGQFHEVPNAFPPVATWTLDLISGDVDGDGLPDVVTAGHGQANVYLSQGAGVFVVGQRLTCTYAQAASLADYDEDGDLDLLVLCGAPFGTGPIPAHLFENDGTGRFAEITSRLPDAGRKLTLGGFVDTDLDGDLDVLATYPGPWPGLQHTQLVNNGSGNLTDVSAATLPTFQRPVRSPGAVVIADLDGDGDPDMTYRQSSWSLHQLALYNMRRHLYPPAPPQPGTPYTIELWGKPGNRMIPVASSASASIPFPPFGGLWIDPVGSVTGAPLTVPASGPATLTLPAPNDPGLVGVSLYLQAFELDVTDPAKSHLTNAFVDTVVP